MKIRKSPFLFFRLCYGSAIMIKKSPGFTLVEIMLVLVIIILLAAMPLQNLLKHRVTANDTMTKAVLRTISTALEMYSSQFNSFPLDYDDLIGDTPPFLSVNYFEGIHNGFSYSYNVTPATYSIIATPVSATAGTASFKVETGGTISEL